MREKEKEDDEKRKTQASILATCLHVFHDECVDDDDDDDDDDDIMIERKQHDFCMDFLFSEMFSIYFVAVCVMLEIRLRGGSASLLVFLRAGSTI